VISLSIRTGHKRISGALAQAMPASPPSDHDAGDPDSPSFQSAYSAPSAVKGAMNTKSMDATCMAFSNGGNCLWVASKTVR
jgi:hypothetical protein